MVYFEDMGTSLPISMEELPLFMDSEEHSVVHSGDVRNFEVVENSGNVVEVTFERNFEGEWRRARTRITSFEPYCRFIEEREGKFAGSRFVGVLRPDGASTRVDVFGDIQCEGKSADETRALWLRVLAKSHEEDLAALRRFRERPPAK